MKETKEKRVNWVWIGVIIILTIGYMINQERIRDNQNARELKLRQSMEENAKILEERKKMQEIHETMQKFEESSKRLDSLNQNK